MGRCGESSVGAGEESSSDERAQPGSASVDDFADDRGHGVLAHHPSVAFVSREQVG